MSAAGRIESTLVPLLRDNIDTDQIIPARFLKGTSRSGLATGLFADWRTGDDAFPLDQERHKESRILLAGDNFGCGSSREHAAWALTEAGFQAVVAPRFADIFRQNALGNRLLAITVDEAVHAALAADRPEPLACSIDIESQTLSWDGGSTTFDLDPFAKRCILRGLDRLDVLLDDLPAIEVYEASRPLWIDTRNAAARLHASPDAQPATAWEET